MTHAVILTRLFVVLDAAIVLLAMLAGFSPLSMIATGLGLAATYYALPAVPYVFLAAQHCAVFLAFVPGYMVFFGRVPGVWSLELEGLDSAVALIIGAIGALASGVALSSGGAARVGVSFRRHSPRMLCVLVVLCFAADWVMRIPKNVAPGGLAQVVNEALKFRYVFLALLFLTVLVQRRGARYALIAALFVALPQATSHMSGWSAVLIIGAYAIVSGVYLGEIRHLTRSYVYRAVAVFVVAGSVTLFLGLVWSGGLKPAWRAAVLRGEVQGSTVERLAAFSEFAVDALADFRAEHAIAELSSRTGSGLVYGALTLNRVPELIPHEGGERTEAALTHILMPRIVFPDKPVLPSDSELVRRYAGVAAAGAESGTSIGLGYIIELFIDFGFAGAIIGCLVFGAYIGGIFRLWHSVCPDPLLVHSAGIVLAWSSLNVYDASLTKILGSVTMQAVVFSPLLYWLHLTAGRAKSSGRRWHGAVSGVRRKRGAARVLAWQAMMGHGRAVAPPK